MNKCWNKMKHNLKMAAMRMKHIMEYACKKLLANNRKRLMMKLNKIKRSIKTLKAIWKMTTIIKCCSHSIRYMINKHLKILWKLERLATLENKKTTRLLNNQILEHRIKKKLNQRILNPNWRNLLHRMKKTRRAKKAAT